MKQILFTALAVLLICAVPLKAQLNNVIVETYYVSDAKDATDSVFVSDASGNVIDTLTLPVGSTTYRVYLSLKAGFKVHKIYGDANHTLKIASDSVFFNNADRGKSYGYQIKKNDLKKGTVALDTWLTIGEVTATIPQTAPLKPYAYGGVPKIYDKDSSFIGAHHNNGGSSLIPGGLLVNKDEHAGVPVDSADGYLRMDSIPVNWVDGGIVVNGVDSTIFGSINPGKAFLSNNAFLQNDGAQGVSPDSNQVLVAQLTTLGKISFELNVEILGPDKSIIKYVAKNGADSLSPDVIQSHFLQYPPQCGCNDPNYLEFNPQVACIDSMKCKTLIVLGCLDTLACNYDPRANKDIVPSLCCYPGKCNDRDLSLACPDLKNKSGHEHTSFELYPNPAQEELTLVLPTAAGQDTRISIYDSFGKKVLESMPVESGISTYKLNVSGLPAGLYLFRLEQGSSVDTQVFIRN
ncbi:MAG TPA: T9SS type A sorting domain-containing protein [Ktedonobacteraceae bacterium]|jgi:hypothetical protein|nr:T9SS type A sorting domain-containing protein [Ktedonobacteraceae bacterium]